MIPPDPRARHDTTSSGASSDHSSVSSSDHSSVSSSDQQVAREQGAKPPSGSRVMSGMRTTGRLHIGHYFGVIKNWLALQADYECYYGAMDWHAMTSMYKTPHDVQASVRDIYAEWIGWGIDPQKSVIFVQSRVPEHLELYMYFVMLTPMGWLERVPTWKDVQDEMRATDTHNIGRFSYPILQAADIAMYRGTHVPIGHDQIPHLELNREIIRRFNFLYGGNLPEPRPYFTETPLLLGSDGRKMSKSYGNDFLLTQEEPEIKKALQHMPTDPARVRRTDPGEPTKCPVYSYHKLFSPPTDLPWVEDGCRTAGIGCGDCKRKLGENINALMAEPRAKKKELLQRPDTLDSIIADGCHRARKQAQETLDQVKQWTGFNHAGDF